MISIIYPYRNRDIQRIKKSLESLQLQSNMAFEVFFVNYGSDENHTQNVEILLENFSFVNYSYLYTKLQPWNKSKALNSVLKTLKSDYFFVADVDMIFDSNFIETALQLSKNKEVWYFQVGFLSQEETEFEKNFEDYTIKFKSNNEATGLTLCPVEAARTINGFDEFYHFWGSEDTDFHVRLKNSGYKVNFYDDRILMLHQCHKIYRSKETKFLTQDLQISGIVQFNHQYLKKAIQENKTVVNNDDWGEVIQGKDHFNQLAAYASGNSKQISNKRVDIDYLLYQELPNLKKGFHAFEIKESDNKVSLKKAIKARIKKNKNEFYSLKSVNDKLLFHFINFYRNHSYNYSVSEDLKSIKFAINKL